MSIERTIEAEIGSIRLQKSGFSGVFVLVEGYSDKIFYERFIDENTCKIRVMSGKPSSKQRVIEAVGKLKIENIQGILGIIDADFDRLINSEHSPDLILTDTHDLETLIFYSLALEKVINEVCPLEKVNKFGRDNIRPAFLKATSSIGYLLWISVSDSLNLSFDNLEFKNFISETNLQIDEKKLITELKNKSSKHNLNSDDLYRSLINKKDSNHDLWQVCCGHHLVKMLCFSLKRLLGTDNYSEVEMSKFLRLAYENTYFANTQMYSAIKAWEEINTTFKILKV